LTGVAAVAPNRRLAARPMRRVKHASMVGGLLIQPSFRCRGIQ
jgi:hypothetical protein